MRPVGRVGAVAPAVEWTGVGVVSALVALVLVLVVGAFYATVPAGNGRAAGPVVGRRLLGLRSAGTAAPALTTLGPAFLGLVVAALLRADEAGGVLELTIVLLALLLLLVDDPGGVLRIVLVIAVFWWVIVTGDAETQRTLAMVWAWVLLLAAVVEAGVAGAARMTGRGRAPGALERLRRVGGLVPELLLLLVTTAALVAGGAVLLRLPG